MEGENVVIPEATTETITTETVDDQLLLELKTTNEFLHYNLAFLSFIIAVLIVIAFFTAKGSGTNA